MLDTDTKRRIDTARDILVGKVPDPKSQVEQITIALIYKFMDDMDAESEELGGKRKFFTGDYARYGWAKLMAPSLGGHEMLGLYGEGISKMPENPGIPALFREIFKNAYLPYRDPETLKAFLKIIDEFSYDHSERLGDAFEYLLSVLGSQGDAGQFRTPRHIIDFMVEVVAPRKEDIILDPACGTAGFLISAYKHILRTNTDAKGHSKLTPDDKGRLAKNFKGYDISPDMVRLSLVNLYLHGFTDPHIYEYDTLTSEERWNEFADVILANPPFMSPKGGIKPHKRLSIQAKRSEVLFVDYMAEHLTPGGRAGIIVPEGIIFQSQTAYKDLRKMLVENSLVAVVSLPAGCFNPYSGVKTSILILDKSLAKAADTIAFFKVENDGFGLGAQRRAFDKNDLPQVQVELAAYLQALRSQQSTSDFQPTCGLIVPKEKIAANGDYNLSGERYREGSGAPTTFVFRAVGDIADEIKAGFASGQSSVDKIGVPHIRPMNITDKGQFTWDGLKQIAASEYVGKEDYALRSGDVLFNNTNSKELVGKTCLIEKDIYGGYSNHMTRIRVKPNLCVSNFLALLLQNAWQKGVFLELANRWVGQAGINATALAQYQIPLPPLEVQKEIVAEIEGYQKVINGARAVLDHYRPHIPIHPDWPMVELGEICSLGGTITTDVDLALPYFGADSIESNTGKLLKTETAQSQRVNGPVYEFTGERLLYSKIRPYLNKLTIVDLRGYCSSDMYPLLPDSSKVQITFLATYMLSDTFNERIRGFYERASIPKINRSQLFETAIPLPPLGTQHAIVAEIEAEQALVAANRELITRFEKKIQATLARVWGESEPAVAEA
jgi:type I restriction enzyme M protein